MGVAAAATALGAYLIGNVINAAYVDKNLPGIIVLALVTALIFLIKALSAYGSSVMMARDRQPHRGAESAADVQRADQPERRVLFGAAFLRVHGAADHGAAAASQVIN